MICDIRLLLKKRPKELCPYCPELLQCSLWRREERERLDYDAFLEALDDPDEMMRLARKVNAR